MGKLQEKYSYNLAHRKLPSLFHSINKSMQKFLFLEHCFFLCQQEQDAFADADEKMMELEAKKSELEAQVKEMLEQLEDEEEASAELSGMKQKMEQEIKDMKADIDDLEMALKKVIVSIYPEHLQKHVFCQEQKPLTTRRKSPFKLHFLTSI